MAKKTTTLKTRLMLDGSHFRRNLRRTRRDLEKFRGQANSIMRKTAIAAGAAAAAAGVIGAQFEQSMANISAVTGKTGRDLKALEAKARELGKSTSYSASQASDALLTLSKAGLKTKESIDAVEGILKFAGASAVEMGEAAEFAVGTMKSFGKTADQTEDIVNTLFATTTRTNASFADLKEAMKLAAPIASTMGMSLESTAATLGTLADQNFKGTLAATAFNEALLKLNDPSEELKEVLGDVTFTGDNLAEVLDQLKKSNFDLRDAFSETYFGRRGARAITILMQQSADKLRENTKAITGTTAAMTGYDRAQDTTIGAVNRFRSAVEEAAIKVFQAWDGKVKLAFDNAAKAVNKHSGKIAEAMGTVVEAVDVTIKKVMGFTKFLYKHGEAVEYVVTVVGTLTAGLYLAAAAQAAFNAVAAINPWVLLATGIIAAGAALVKYVDSIGGWRVAIVELKGQWDKFIEEWRYTFAWYGVQLDYLVDYFQRTWATIGAAVDAWRIAIVDNWRALFTGDFRTVLDEAQAIMNEKYAMIWDGFEEKHEGALKAVVDEHKERMDEIVFETENAVLAATGVLKEFKLPAPEWDKGDLDRDAARKRAREAIMGIQEGSEGGAAAFDFSFPEPQKRDVAPEPDMTYLKTYTDRFAETNDEMDRMTTQLWSTLEDTWREGWDSVLDVDMTGKQRREAIWGSMKQGLWRMLGDMVKNWITSETVTTKLTIMAEKAKTSAKAGGATARASISAAEQGVAAADTAASTTQASAGFFAAFSKIPFVGVALALGAIATMIAAIRGLPKFATGGLVGGGGGIDQRLIRASHDEYVVNANATRENLGLLEAINSGVPGAMALGGSGAGGGDVHFHVPSGSMLVADDEAGVDRLATLLHDATERGIKTRYRE